MFELDTKTAIPSVSRVSDILTLQNSRFGIMLDFDRMMEYEAYYGSLGVKMINNICKYIYPNGPIGMDYYTFTDTHMLAFLRRSGVTGFLLTPAGKESLSEESVKAVIDTGRYSKELNLIMQKYVEAKHYLKLVSAFPNMYKQSCGISGVETWDNHRMLVLRPDWVGQNTGRLATANPGTMNLSKEIADIFTVPKGWKYIEVDSGQIEPRLIQSFVLKDPQLKKCTMLYNDAYYGYIHYCTILTDEQRRSGTLDFEPIEITDEMKAKRKKFKTYGNATMYGSTENREGDPDKDAFIKCIGGHPNRIKLVSEIERDLIGGKRIFNTAFGTPIDITKGPSDKNFTDKTSKAYFAHLTRCAINNPIQGTAGDLMRYSVERAYNLLLREAPHSFIMQYVHDAGKFAIHESEYDKVIDRIKEITAYQVEDWIPIYAEAEEGIHESPVKRFVL